MVVVTALTVAAQDNAQSMVIIGKVVDGNGVPVPRATVSLLTANVQRSILSTSNGGFVFAGVPRGSAALWAEKAGYAGGMYGALEPPTAPCAQPSGGALTITPQSTGMPVELILFKEAILAGRVMDRFGDGVAGITVSTFTYSVRGGREKLLRNLGVETDDRGLFRLAVPPGEYALGAGDVILAGNPVAFQRSSAYSLTFYPNTVTPTRITARSGEEQGGLDIRMGGRIGGRISGNVRFDNSLPEPSELQLVRVDAAQLLSEIPIATSLVDEGKFSFPFVPAGNYAIRAVKYPPASVGPAGTRRVNQSGAGEVIGPSGVVGVQSVASAPSTLAAGIMAEVQVQQEDIKDFLLETRPLFPIEGSVQFDDALDSTSREKVRTLAVSVVAADGHTLGLVPATAVDEDGRFRTAGFPAGKYLLRVHGLETGLPGWHVSGVFSNGQESSLHGFEIGSSGAEARIVLSRKAIVGRLEGRIALPTGLPAAATVLAFPADERNWLDFGPKPASFAVTTSNADGSFILDLPQASYFVVSKSRAVRGCWMESSVLAQLARESTTVKILGGERSTIRLVAK
jgi:hypothetical protein